MPIELITDHVICNAGFYEPCLLLEEDVRVYRSSKEINYLGAVHVVKTALPDVAATPLAPHESKRRVVFVVSIAPLAMFIACSSHTASTFALRGLSEALRNELKLYDIDVSIFFPGKISTPMIERELPSKPAAAIIDAPSTIVSAEVAARALVDGIATGQYAITTGLLGEMLRTTANGVVPRNNTLLEMLLQPLWALLQTPHRMYSDWIVRREARNA